MIEGIVAVALEKRPRYRPLSGQARASLSSGSSFRHRVRPGVTFADFASIGPSDAHTSAGAVGAAITKRYFDLGWMERMKRSQAVIVTPPGRRGFLETFSIDASTPGDRRKD
jgi:hypothetical protein